MPRHADPPPTQDGPVQAPLPREPHRLADELDYLRRRIREMNERLGSRIQDLADRLDTGTTVAGELDVAAAGLDPEQEIRARALAAAIEHLATTGELPDWVHDGDLAEPVTVLKLADRYAAWIRDGSPADDDVEEASTR